MHYASLKNYFAYSFRPKIELIAMILSTQRSEVLLVYTEAYLEVVIYDIENRDSLPTKAVG